MKHETKPIQKLPIQLWFDFYVVWKTINYLFFKLLIVKKELKSEIVIWLEVENNPKQLNNWLFPKMLKI